MDIDQLLVTEGSVFCVSHRTGNIRPRTMEGFYSHDTRFLSTFRVLVDGRELSPVGATEFNHSVASFYTTVHSERNVPQAAISMVCDRYVDEGLHEDIQLVNHTHAPRTVHLEITFDADFADIFEVRRGSVRKVGRATVENREGQHLCLVYRRGHFHRETWVSFSAEPQIKGKVASFEILLEPKEMWKTCVTILPVVDQPPLPMKCLEIILGPPFGAYWRQEAASIGVLRRNGDSGVLQEGLPRLEADHEGLRRAYDQAISDLRALRIEYVPGAPILAAGVPWFVAVFGRDSIISAIQTKLLGPELMIGTLNTLASLQARTTDRFRESNPGKIAHEVRKGELSVFEQVPHSRYYGTVDATPLFLILLWEAYQWTGDLNLVRQLLPAADAALRWIDRYGDTDGDGFIEYQRQTRHGLRNQGWKDSSDAISFADGRLAEGPIALAEVQGYVFDARCKMAELYHLVGEPNRARRLERAARQLKEQFNQAFWLPQAEYFALALDGKKQPVDSISSNPGHCLWSGIIDQDKAEKVAQRLMAPDMLSGWGIRTLSTEMARYNPLSYHNGSVWPHDNSIIAAGLARYGFIREANEVAMVIIDAASGFLDHRLPELFAGYPRREYSFPVPYPAANAPQAWACGAIIYLLETLLGVIPSGDRLLQEAPHEGIYVSLSGVLYRGSRRVL